MSQLAFLVRDEGMVRRCRRFITENKREQMPLPAIKQLYLHSRGLWHNKPKPYSKFPREPCFAP